MGVNRAQTSILSGRERQPDSSRAVPKLAPDQSLGPSRPGPRAAPSAGRGLRVAVEALTAAVLVDGLGTTIQYDDVEDLWHDGG